MAKCLSLQSHFNTLIPIDINAFFERQTGGQKGSSIQDQMLRLSGYLLLVRLEKTSPRQIGIFRNIFLL